MYKIAYVTGPNGDISTILKRTIEDINLAGGRIEHIVQSQSTGPAGFTNVTVTIVYSTGR